MGKNRKKMHNQISNSNQKSKSDGVQILNNQVQDAHPIESSTLSNGLFDVEIKDSLIDPDTRYYI